MRHGLVNCDYNGENNSGVAGVMVGMMVVMMKVNQLLGPVVQCSNMG